MMEYGAVVERNELHLYFWLRRNLKNILLKEKKASIVILQYAALIQIAHTDKNSVCSLFSYSSGFLSCQLTHIWLVTKKIMPMFQQFINDFFLQQINIVCCNQTVAVWKCTVTARGASQRGMQYSVLPGILPVRVLPFASFSWSSLPYLAQFLFLFKAPSSGSLLSKGVCNTPFLNFQK